MSWENNNYQQFAMRKMIGTSKSQNKVIQISGSTTKYEIKQEQVLRNLEVAAAGNNKCQNRFVRKSNRYEILRKQNKNYKQELMGNLLNQLMIRRKSYSLQMIKLLYLFPDDTFSENISISSYDRLFYQDEHIHTLVKIYETKQMECKIWAFLNLKNLHIKRKLEKFTDKIEKIKEKRVQLVKKQSFNMLHLYSIKIQGQKAETAAKQEKQKIEPIRSTLRIDETFRTEKIERTNVINTVNNVEKSQKVEKHYSPLVKRIHLTADDVKVIYPSTIRMAGTGQTHQGYRTYTVPQGHATERSTTQHTFSQKIRQRETIVNQGKDSNSVTVKKVTQQRKQIERPTVYSTLTSQGFRKIQPVEIRTTPYNRNQCKTAHQVRQKVTQRSRQRRSDGYEYLVNTVGGNCTINIHNGCTHSQSSVGESSRLREVSNSRPSASIAYIESNGCQNYHTCCQSMPPCQSFGHKIPPCHQMYAIHAICSCECRRNSIQHREPSCSHSGSYSLEQRIKYLQRLEEMNKKMQMGKRFFKQ